MKQTTKIRLLTLGMVILLTGGVMSTMQALPPGGIGMDDLYYSDDTFTVPVGERYQECYSGRYAWGVRSPYVERSSWGCQIEPTPYCIKYACDGDPGQTYTDANGETYYFNCVPFADGPCSNGY